MILFILAVLGLRRCVGFSSRSADFHVLDVASLLLRAWALGAGAAVVALRWPLLLLSPLSSTAAGDTTPCAPLCSPWLIDHAVLLVGYGNREFRSPRVTTSQEPCPTPVSGCGPRQDHHILCEWESQGGGRCEQLWMDGHLPQAPEPLRFLGVW